MDEPQNTSTPPPTPPPPPPADSGGGDTGSGGSGGGGGGDNNGLMIVLSYLWLLALIPLLVEKDNKEVQWHAKHGIVLMVAELALWIVLTVISFTLAPVGIGCAIALLQMVLSLVIIIIHIVCMVKGVGGGRFLIPGVSQYADRF